MTRDPLTVTLPQLMREASPFLRLIIIFRDPVDRYFSAFYYYRWGTGFRCYDLEAERVSFTGYSL